MSMVDLRGGKHTPPSNTAKLGINSNTSLVFLSALAKAFTVLTRAGKRREKLIYSHILGNVGLGKYYKHALQKSDFLGGLFVFVFPIPTSLTHNIRFLSITSFLGSTEPTCISWDPLSVAFLIFNLSFTFLRKPRWISEA
jgi:hypothetical protein